MTYREAISLVARMSDVERVGAHQDRDRVLAKVARWPEDDPVTWAELTEAVGVMDWSERPPEVLVQLPTPRKSQRHEALKQLWASKPWTSAELSAATGLTENSLKGYKRTVFRGYSWRIETRGKFNRAYQLVIPEATCPAA